eukprot:3604850-Pyramimonas_sp.AAC.2
MDRRPCDSRDSWALQGSLVNARTIIVKSSKKSESKRPISSSKAAVASCLSNSRNAVVLVGQSVSLCLRLQWKVGGGGVLVTSGSW